MWNEILVGLSLMFVFEGIVLAAGPNTCKKAMLQFIQMSSSNIRVMGLSSMLLGLVILLLVK